MYRFFKRSFDFLASLLLFLLISPLFLLLILLVRIKLGKPVFFRQTRTGLHKKPFTIIKFRTMTNARDAEGNLLPDEQRQTKFGKLLRSSSLDELPELLSIIKGDMAVIGPRPLPPSYDAYYTDREAKRFDVRGGLIPPDSVENDPVISWGKQLECEAHYAETLRFRSDLRILAAVFRILIHRDHTDYGSYVRQSLPAERTAVPADHAEKQ